MIKDNFSTNNLAFITRNSILSNLNTGNQILDMIIGMLICSLLTSIIGLFEFRKITSFFELLKNKFTFYNENCISFKVKSDEPNKQYKALLYYATKKYNPDIFHLKFYTYRSYDYREDRELIDDNFTINENKKIKICDDIFLSCYKREESEKLGRDYSRDVLYFIINICSKKKSCIELQNFISNVVEEYDTFLLKKMLKKQYFIEINYNLEKKRLIYNDFVFDSKKTFNNLFFTQKDECLKKIEKFINGKDWYDKRGLPYTLGFLLHGEPGCGKTSFIKALLNHTKRHGIYINLHNNFDLEKLKKIMLCDDISDYIIEPDNRILIFEDIDCMGDIVKNRENKEKENEENKEKDEPEENNKKNRKKEISDALQELISTDKNKPINNNNNLSYLLNIFDGPIETPGRICIFTTNHKDKLDKALIRPGRVDCDINFTKCTKKMLLDTINNFFDTKLNIDIVKNYVDYSLSPADINNLCFKYNNIETVLKNIIKN